MDQSEANKPVNEALGISKKRAIEIAQVLARIDHFCNHHSATVESLVANFPDPLELAFASYALGRTVGARNERVALKQKKS